jgi:hypothetical protein
MAIDATVGGVSANSYVTLDEAYDYFAAHPYASAWITAGDTGAFAQEALLIQAALWVDQLEPEFEGSRAATTQALAFPRSGVRDAGGTALGDDVVPLFVKRAQYEAVLAIANENPFADTGLEGFKRVKVGPIEIETRARGAGSLPSHVRRFLRPVLGLGSLQFRIVRA